MKSLKEFIGPLKELLKVLESLDPETSEDFPELKKLVESKEWPTAVDSDQIVTNEEEKLERAEGIIQMTLPPNKNISVLDVGCGEGHFVMKAIELGYKLVVGYDIKDSNNFKWDNDKKGLLTKNWNKVEKNGPYDKIVLIDVLDHVVNEDHVDLLKKVKSVLKPEGLIFASCHPWCSRHGSHLYTKINKAWVHLVFTEEELKELKYIPEFYCHPVFFPRKTYEDWFKAAGLEVSGREIDRANVESFFSKNSLVKQRIMNVFDNPEKFPQYQMEQTFINYILRPSNA